MSIWFRYMHLIGIDGILHDKKHVKDLQSDILDMTEFPIYNV